MFNKRAAFSLIELMVVIALVSVLAVVATPIYKEYLAKSRLSEASNFLKQFSEKLILYYNENSQFPGTMSELGYSYAYPPTSINVVAPHVPVLFLDDIDAAACPTVHLTSYVVGLYGSTELPDYLGGVSTNYEGIVAFNNYLLNVKGMFRYLCSYTYSNSNGTPRSGTFLENCVNATDDADYIADTLAELEAICAS
jgi:prepilin-type N-terminal cleavage/methylation domain-containing protein